MSLKIEDYAMIGDGQTAALIGRDGSVDWLCWPRFDSPSIFARILGDEENGRWRIAPTDADAKVSWRYRDDTLVLETRYETGTGTAIVTDFMPPLRPECYLMRVVQGLRGTVEFEAELLIRPNYGIAIPWIRRDNDGSIRAVVGPSAMILYTDLRLEPDGRRHTATFTVGAGDTQGFTLGYHLPFQDPPPKISATKALEETETIMRKWSKQYEGGGPYEAMVKRSLLVLRALIYHPSGAIVAAPTTSLPELIGGGRNWDYRYCWLRDATLTLMALMNGGYIEEARRWRQWLLRSIGGDPSQIQIMYGIGGEQRIPEIEIPQLAGYEGSKPVRVGNAAAGQLQIDIYGELLDALFQARKRGLSGDDDDWTVQIELLKHLETVWTEKDEGIWEVRGGAAALHVLQGDGLGRLRPCNQDRRAVRPTGAGRDVAQVPRQDPRRRLREGLEREDGRLHPGLRLGQDGRLRAADRLERFLAARRQAHSRHRRCGRARAAQGWLRQSATSTTTTTD